MRKTSDVTDTPFPFGSQAVPFILVVTGDHYVDGHTKDARGFEHASTHDKKLALVCKAQDLQETGAVCSLLAVWPGRNRSDVFLVDDLDLAIAALAPGAAPTA
jgi:hypothetical protein